MADDGPVELESLCMRCGENGTTRILLSSIPHFREIVISAFECPHCNESNNEVQFAGQLQPEGCRFVLRVPKGERKVLDRQVVKSDSATVKVPELDFEVPPEAQRGVLSTVEGILARAADGLGALQDERRKVEPEIAEQLDAFILKLREYAAGEHEFTFILDDPSGNSFIENPYAPEEDPILSKEHYKRTSEQQRALGFLATEEELGGTAPEPAATTSLGLAKQLTAIAKGSGEEISALTRYSAPEEVMTFPATCGACAAACETRMYMTNIPYFKEVIVMASTCDVCGYKDSELKPGGSVPPKAKKITVRVTGKEDLCRDVIKSTTASVEIPELDLELGHGTLGGVVTTVEGLLTKISDQLKQLHIFEIGDSADPTARKRWKDFHSRISQIIDLEQPWTLILDDPLANSFVAATTNRVEDDSQITIEEYQRSREQDEELGLTEYSE